MGRKKIAVDPDQARHASHNAPQIEFPALSMQVEMWPIDRPTPYQRNPRRNDASVEAVAASLKEFGWQQPIVVDESGVVVVGHTRLKAAKLLGMTEVPVHVATGLTPSQVKAYRIADNSAGSPMQRLAMLRQLHDAGVQTWASIEPVLDAAESLAIIKASLPDVDAYKIGRLNHVKNQTNWLEFLRDAVALLRGAGKRFYVKEDLRAVNDGSVQLSAAECDQDALVLRCP